jgi:hypothetical protein
MSRITDILESQGRELAKLQDDQARTLLRLAEDARREVRERLETLVASDRELPYTAQTMRVMLAQVSAAADTLKLRMGDTLASGVTATQRKALVDLLATIRENEGEFTDAGNTIEWRTVARLTDPDALLLHRYSLDTYGATVVQRVQQELALGLLQGASIPGITRRIASASGKIAGLNGRAELIARMEINKAYNDGHQAALEEAAAVLDDPGTPDPLMRRIDEYIDARNHPFSRVANGLVTAIDKPFLVPVSEVARVADAMKKSAGGVLWPDDGGFYIVQGLPAHFGDRARLTPYRASWDNGAGLGFSAMRSQQQANLPTALRRAQAG